MMKLHRPLPPQFLQENYKNWGRDYHKRRQENPTAKFSWRHYQLLVEKLEEMSGQHCSFCDGYPLGPFARKTVEHFRPKSKYPKLAYVWHNLFICCDKCQSSKLETFDKKLLKPDQVAYDFYRYFILNFTTGEIEANPAASAPDQMRAEITIEIYGLNAHDRPQRRVRERQMYQDLKEKNYQLDDFSYRFFIE